METFIVLGLCFILYEALDLFQSCYNNNQRHQSFTNSSSCSSSSGNTECIAGINNSSDSISVNKDTARLVRLDSIEELDSDDTNQSNQFDKSKVFSICDRVINHHHNLSHYNNNNNVGHPDDVDKLIIG